MRGVQSGQLAIRASVTEEKSRVDLEIGDTGRGISDKVRSQLFAPGVSTKEGRLGIGLWWCRTFMRATGGDIDLLRTSSHGTSFVVAIPCSAFASSSDQETHSSRLEDVLIVEDDLKWREALRDTISDEDYSITTTSSFAEARDALRSSCFRVAVVDVSLADSDPTNLDGLRLVKEIEEANSHTKIILITGWGGEEGRRVAETNSTVIAFVDKKSFDLGHFRSIVGQAVASG